MTVLPANHATGVAATVACQDHATAPAVVRCSQCGRALCDVCYDQIVDAKPACLACGYEAATRSQRRVSLAITFLGLGLGLSFWLWRHPVWGEELEGWVFVLAAAVVLVTGLIFALWNREGPEAARRDREVDPDPRDLAPALAHPYRARLRRVAVRFTPRVSGAATAAVVGASFVLAAVALPLSLQLPRWLEAEAVLALWWLALSATFTVLLFRGFRLKDDYFFVPFWKRSSSKDTESASWLPDGTSSCGCDGCGDVGEGAVAIVAIAVVLAVVFGLAWIVAEIALPLVLFASYSLLHRALTRVAHDTHGCQGELARSSLWGTIWSTLFLVPLAAIVWAVHAATN